MLTTEIHIKINIEYPLLIYEIHAECRNLFCLNGEPGFWHFCTGFRYLAWILYRQWILTLMST